MSRRQSPETQIRRLRSLLRQGAKAAREVLDLYFVAGCETPVARLKDFRNAAEAVLRPARPPRRKRRRS